MPAEHDTHYTETQRRFNMGPGSGTTWESVVEIEYFVEEERLANLPNGYFHPGMSIIRRAQLSAIVPKSVTHMPDNVPTPGPSGTRSVSSLW
jgi:hypothetical protein